MSQHSDAQSIAILIALREFAKATPRMYSLLVRQFHSPQGIVAADEAALTALEQIPERVRDRILDVGDQLARAKDILTGLTDRDISVVTQQDSAYPHSLFELNDPPVFLLYRGAMPDPQKKTVALAGAETPTAEGIELTSNVAQKLLDSGVQILAPLSGGISAAVHLAVRSRELPAFAILDSGFDTIEQQAGMPLAIDIVQDGGVISEYLPGVEQSTQTVSESNRLLAALSHAVVITEAYEDSTGALDLLLCCQELGKLAFVMVASDGGSLLDKKSLEYAIQNGAIPVDGIEQVSDLIVPSLV